MFANTRSFCYNEERKGCVKMNIISVIADTVESACKSKNNVFGYGVWSHHIISVVEYAKLLALELDADTEVVQLAALLHDYAGIIDPGKYKEHHIYGMEEAERLLSHYRYPQEKIEMVKACIYSHRGSVDINRKTIEEICVSDADAIAHITNVPSLLYLAYHRKNMSIEEGASWVSSKIERSYNKLSVHGKELIRKKYMRSKDLLQEMAV